LDEVNVCPAGHIVGRLASLGDQFLVFQPRRPDLESRSHLTCHTIRVDQEMTFPILSRRHMGFLPPSHLRE
jgi:hypothetical protein